MAPLAEASTSGVEPMIYCKHKIIEKRKKPQSEMLREEDAAADNTNNVKKNEVVLASNSRMNDVTDHDTMGSTFVYVEDSVKKRVQFNVVDVVEFEPTMWTATVSSEGVPLGISVDVRCRTKRSVDIYEIERVIQRVDRQDYMELGYLEPEERLDILENAGHSISIISHVERETLRINRERWESNEYDLMYQYGLGEIPLMEDDGGLEMVQQPVDDDNMHVDDSSDDDFFFGGSVRSMVMDSDVCFAMEDMDAYDAINTRTYDDLSVDYDLDCILGDNDSSDQNNELPYAIDSFDSSYGCDYLEMRTLPLAMPSSSNCMLACATVTSCAQSVGTICSASSPTESTVISVKVASVVAA